MREESNPIVRLCPMAGAQLLQAAASGIVAQNRALLPDLSSLTIVLPALSCIPLLTQSLAGAADEPTLLLPRMTTLRDWAKQSGPVGETISDASRQAMLYQALRTRNWFPESDLWHISAELLRLMDEITGWEVGLPASLEDFVKQLQLAYQARAGEALQFEARLVYESWHALTGSNSRQADSATCYQLQLAQLAASASAPLYAIGLPHLAPVEKAFFESYAKAWPVQMFATDFSRPEDLPPLVALLHAAWQPHSSPDSDLRSRALRFKQQYPQSPLPGRIALFGAGSLEEESQAVDAKVRLLLLAGSKSIAVIVQDRLVARRARALLERAQILVEDETGWTFSTTAASTVIMRWLDAVSSNFYYQDLLDLLKSPYMLADWPASKRKHAVHCLERELRRHSVVSHLEHYLTLARENADATEMLLRLKQARPLLDQAAKPLPAWLKRLRESLEMLGIAQGLQADIAGRQLLQLLSRLQLELEADSSKFSSGQWRQWLNHQFEAATFRDERIQSPVIFTHLAATRLRRFDAVIMIGCDAGHLPGDNRENVFFNQAVRAQLGLPTYESELRQTTEDLIALLAGCDTAYVTWQAARDAEANAPSPYFELLETFHLIAYGTDLRDRQMTAMLPCSRVSANLPYEEETAPVPAANPRPTLPPEMIPDSVTASGYNSLMACPYQYYARHALRLNELDEVQLALEKKDYGSYVHQILQRFHARSPMLLEHDRSSLEQQLRAITREVFAAAIEADYLSHAWALRWEAIIPSYLDWQVQRETEGWHWLEGEMREQLEIMLPDGHKLALCGTLDRVDARDSEHAVLDYKNQSKTRLKNKLGTPGEDVQLPVYAMLLGKPVEAAAYVSLDDGKAEAVNFPDDIMMAGEAVLARLRTVFQQMRSRAPLPAQGTDEVCKYCEMRGLCRKDYWLTAGLSGGLAEKEPAG